MIFSPEEEMSGLQLLGRLKEAEYLRQRLHRALLDVLPDAVDQGALARNHGRRIFAAEILKALETPESADARSDIASLLHRPQRPVQYGDASRRRVPDIGPDDEFIVTGGSSQRIIRRPRAERRLHAADETDPA